MRLKISLFWRNSSSFNLQGFFNGVDERKWKKTITEDLKELIMMLPVALYSEGEQEADFQLSVRNVDSLSFLGLSHLLLVFFIIIINGSNTLWDAAFCFYLPTAWKLFESPVAYSLITMSKLWRSHLLFNWQSRSLLVIRVTRLVQILVFSD